MMDLWAKLNTDRARAVCGTVALHVIMFSVLFVWAPPFEAPRPIEPSVIVIDLVPPPEPEEIENEPEIIVEAELIDPEPAEQVAQIEEVVAPEEDLPPAPDIREPSNPSDEILITPSGEDLERQGETEATDVPTVPPPPEIDPRYKVEFDPFAETSPSALARVSKAVNCSRVNRDTRPAFCPDYDEDDIYLAGFNRETNVYGKSQYDPVYDVAATRNILFNSAARKTRPHSNARSDVPVVEFHRPVVPDKDCQVVTLASPISPSTQFGIGGGVADTRTVHCGSAEPARLSD